MVLPCLPGPQSSHMDSLSTPVPSLHFPFGQPLHRSAEAIPSRSEYFPFAQSLQPRVSVWEPVTLPHLPLGHPRHLLKVTVVIPFRDVFSSSLAKNPLGQYSQA